MNKAYQQAQLAKRIKAKYGFVKIGDQYWTSKNFAETQTVLNTPIKEIQLNANVEKITNIADREFSSDTGYWNKTNCTISDGTCKFKSGSLTALSRGAGLISGKYYKIQLTISDYVAGSFICKAGSGGNSPIMTANGTYIYYSLCGGSYIEMQGLDFTTNLSIDNVSIQEIGRKGALELYNGIYSQTGGTSEQKMYAALKASAFWCDYNNLASNGLIYGHLYNWFAIKLLQVDIDYYNAQLLANYGNTPQFYTKRYEWNMPTQSNYETLGTYLGGIAVAGGKLKKEGTTGWFSPNTGATNESGFSCIGCGFSNSNGDFGNLNQYTFLNTITESGDNSYKPTLDKDLNSLGNSFYSKIFCASLRLIKSQI